MKRLWITVVALTAVLAIGLASMAMGARNGQTNTLVKTRLSLAYDPGSTSPYDDDYNQANFNGKVKAKKKVCRKKRKVSVKNLGTGVVVGKTKTNRRGVYRISAGSGAAKGTYQAKVKKKTIKKKNGNRIICSKAKSKKLTIN